MTTKGISLLIAAALLLGSCSKSSKCGEKVCDESFASLTIRFLNKNGQDQQVKNYSVVNTRTGDTVKTTSAIVSDVGPGTYFIVDDGYTDKLSEAGDDLKISGTSIANDQTKTATVKVAGGECACHIKKVSGPNTITFD